MHALMQQLDDLNAAHALDHLGVRKKNETEPAQKQPKPAAKPPKAPQKTAAKTTKPAQKEPDADTAQPEPDTEEPEPYKDDSLLGKLSSFTTKAKQSVLGKPLSAQDVQQSFCEIASVCGDWPPKKIAAMQKMLQGNHYTDEHCPTSKRYTIPTRK
jgi:uncharacterized Zn finger protein (UPF0148 family)